MLTLFATPKAFQGHIGVIQRNAITSWTRLVPRPEILLFGTEPGTRELAAELGVRHIPQVECNEHGTPLLSSLFRLAQEVGQGNRFAYVNADIILFDDFVAAVSQVPFEQFLLAGQRSNLEVTEPIPFETDWQTGLRDRALHQGQLEGPQAIDYFVFPRGIFLDIPPFAIGRLCWDNWILYKTLQLNLPLIDATAAVLALHQNHDYNHHPQGKAGVFAGTEAQQNLQLLGGRDYAFFMLTLANWQLTPTGLCSPDWSLERLFTFLHMLPLVNPEFRGWAALLHHLLHYRLHSSLSDAEMARIQTNLGQAFWGSSDCWFQFSVQMEEDAMAIYLPTPAEQEAMNQVKSQLHKTQADLERARRQIAAMKTSKFWHLRSQWFKLKRHLGLAAKLR